MSGSSAIDHLNDQPHDEISDVLQSIRVRSVVYCLSDLRGPWGFRVEGAQVAKFHLMLAGSCWLELDGLRLFETDGDEGGCLGGQWEDGNNALAIAPGTVVAFEWNAGTNARLRRAGIDVIAIAAGELSRSGGGPRAMACPLARSPALDD